jgi:ABC-type branched-subunit amino acid transport system substrate-binding protein
MLDAVTNHASHTITGARRPIRLGALAPLSRPGFCAAVHHLRAGVELAVDAINDAGGIGGRPVELVLRDTAGAPDQAVATVRNFAAEGAVAVVGEYHSVVAHAAAGAAVDEGLPFVCSSARPVDVHAVRRQRTWRLVIPVPAQRHRDGRAGRPLVRFRLQLQNCFVGKRLTH